MAYVRTMKRVSSIDGSGPIIISWPVNASQTIVAGSVVVINTSKLDVGAAAASAGTIAGVATQALTTGTSVDTDDVVDVDINPNSIWSMTVDATGSKKSLDAEDIGKTFDLVTNAYTADLDDTTDGFLQYIGGYNSTNGTANFLVKGSLQNV